MTGGPWTRSMKVVHGPGPKWGSMFCPHPAATALFIAVKGFFTAAEICNCCSQRFYSSFLALLEAILQRCSSAARFIQVYLP